MSELWLRISDHAAVRWHQHTDSPGVGPRVAWGQAQPVSLHDVDGDEVRFHQRLALVLVRRDDTLVTVIDATVANSTELRDLAREGVAEA